MNGKRAHTNHVGDLERAPERVEEQAGADATPLRLGMHGEAREYQDRDWMARHAFDDALGGIRVMHLAGDDRIKADELATAYADIGL